MYSHGRMREEGPGGFPRAHVIEGCSKASRMFLKDKREGRKFLPWIQVPTFGKGRCER